jgi:hypothetical protein
LLPLTFTPEIVHYLKQNKKPNHMKNKFFTMAIFAMGLATAANAQNAATESTTTASAQIVVPISISKVTDLNFGSIISSTAGGTVVLAPSGTVTPTGVSMFTGTNTVATSAAEYTISGEAGQTYVITMPADNTVVLSDGGTNSMQLTAFTHNATGTFGASSETFQVGATLNVGANQAAGNYVSTAFDVTVAYN